MQSTIRRTPAEVVIKPEQSSALLQEKKGIDWKYHIAQYGFAVTVAAPIYAALSLYLFYRRGYYDLYIANKIFAGTAAVLLGVVLLIGPLSRFFSFPDRYVQYRKELGIVAFLLSLVHGVSSLLFLPSYFPLAGYLGTPVNWPFVYGAAATLVLAALFAISNEGSARAIGRKTWWLMHNWGVRLAFVLVFLHVFVMKWPGWVKWYKMGGGKELVRPDWPGAGILVGWFLAFVVLVRLSEFGGQKFGRLAWYFSVIGLPAVYLATFWWGGQLVK